MHNPSRTAATITAVAQMGINKGNKHKQGHEWVQTSEGKCKDKRTEGKTNVHIHRG
jgi:hypothetical protein